MSDVYRTLSNGKAVQNAVAKREQAEQALEAVRKQRAKAEEDLKAAEEKRKKAEDSVAEAGTC